MQPEGGQFYKVKLSTGRVLGPLDLPRIRLLIQKNQITGHESARKYPQGEWEDINAIAEIAELLVKKASDDLSLNSVEAVSDGSNRTAVLPAAATQVLPPEPPAFTTDENDGAGKTQVFSMKEAAAALEAENPGFDVDDGDNEKTRVVGAPEKSAPAEDSDGATQVISTIPEPGSDFRNVANESTVVFDRAALADKSAGTQTGIAAAPKKKFLGIFEIPERKALIRGLIVVCALGLLVQELFFPEEPEKTAFKISVIRPKLPVSSSMGTNPQRSQKLYLQGLHFYVQDTVVGYKVAAEYFLQAASHDINNVKALAMLASAYINLIDSSAKDESYFSVISKLIEMSRAKATELMETVIADVEFYVVTGRAEAAQNRIVEFAKTSQRTDITVFFYLAYSLYWKGDLSASARYLNQIADNKIPTPKFFYYRGMLAEKLNDTDAALVQYQKAIQLGKNHARSRVRIADILAKRGKLREAGPYLDFVVNNPTLLPPKELGLAYYLHSQLNALYQKWNLALSDVERSVKLDPTNHDYLLEMYTLRAKLGESSPEFQKEARMYFYLGEGEKLLKESKFQEALTFFLKARQANLAAALPLKKIGDMFMQINDVHNAQMNYKLAMERSPNNIEIAGKYLDVLIRGYEWEDAEREIKRLRGLPVNQGVVDKAQGDLLALKGRYAEAAIFYKKAMSRDSIDPSVYTAFAGALAGAGDYKDAPFFYTLALRFDPRNTEALLGIAKAKAESESIGQAIDFLQDELQKLGGTKAELLAAIGEYQAQKGEWAAAQSFTDQAMKADPEYPYPWKVQAKIYLAREGTDKNAVEKALDAYQSYIDRNPYDASGYYEKHRIYVKKLDYGSAEGELNRISAIYPKYPNLHLYRGNLYSAVGNYREAVKEFDQELKNNPHSQQALVAMGKAQIHHNAPDEALRYLNTAMGQNPRDPEAKTQAAIANYLLKNYAGAAALFEAASQLDPGNPQIFKRLGLAYREIGNAAAARKAFQRYLEMEPDAPDRREFQNY